MAIALSRGRRSAIPPATDIPPGEVTALLQAWQAQGDGQAQGGGGQALPTLMAAVAGDLRRMARAYLSRERPGHTLEPTALVHEVYVRLFDRRVGPLEDRRAFFCFAGRLMRQILVDYARARRATKRGGGADWVPLEQALGCAAAAGPTPEDILTLDAALRQLGALDERQRRVVELRYFVGLTVPEVAQVLAVSIATVERDWSFARSWLARAISRASGTTCAA